METEAFLQLWGPALSIPIRRLEAACYNSLTIGANGDKVNLNAGIYVINGGEIHFGKAGPITRPIRAERRLLLPVGNASLVIDKANVNLTALPGTHAGTLIFQDSADTQVRRRFKEGPIQASTEPYAPSSNVTLGNGSGTAIDADLVAKTLTMNGGGTLQQRHVQLCRT